MTSSRCTSANPRQAHVCSRRCWWLMPMARGEKIVMSVPRSRCSLSCAPSRLLADLVVVTFSDVSAAAWAAL